MRIDGTRERGQFLSSMMIALLACAIAAGCVRYEARPLVPEATLDTLEARRLDAPELEEFLRKNAGVAEWPPAAWDLDALTLAALYYSPDLDVARARWGIAKAQTVTAGARPNPTASALMGYNASAAAGVTPWIPELLLGLPVETAGKRGSRISESRHLSEAARLDVISAAWGVRSRVRRAFLAVNVVQRTERLLAAQLDLESEGVKLLERQHQAGEVSGNEVTVARIALDHTKLEVLEAGRRSREALIDLAQAMGMPSAELEGIDLSFDALERVDLELPTREIQHRALVSRTDILGALSRYEASQSALRLEIAKQYPDIDIGAGFQLDQTDSKWTLSLSLPIPIPGRSKGPIAEAEARRAVEAAQFLALQAQVIGRIQRAIAACRAAKQSVTAADTILSHLQRAEDTMESAYRLGEISRIDLVGAQLEVSAGRMARLEALSRAQEAVGALEEAMQSPLQMDGWVLIGRDDE